MVCGTVLMYMCYNVKKFSFMIYREKPYVMVSRAMEKYNDNIYACGYFLHLVEMFKQAFQSMYIINKNHFFFKFNFVIQ